MARTEHLIRVILEETLTSDRIVRVTADSPEDAARLARDALNRVEDEGWIDLRTGEEYPHHSIQAGDDEHVMTKLEPTTVDESAMTFLLLADDGSDVRQIDPDAEPGDPPPAAPPISDAIALVLKFAEAFFEQGQDDDVSEEERAEREEGEAALERVNAWLTEGTT